MHRQIIILIALLMGLARFEANAQGLVINEFMSSNATVISDEDGDYEDWIEIFNGGSTSVNLLNYGLTDNPSNPFRWQFPDITIEPQQFLLVWASGKNRKNPGMPLHTSFSISAQGEELMLTHANGQTLDHVPSTALITDISYGRQPDGTANWYFFESSTPNQGNTGQVFEGILSPPELSQISGFYTQGFSLSITHPDAQAEIIFTRDGSAPDAENLAGKLYPYKNIFPYRPGNESGPLLQGSIHSYVFNGSPLFVEDRSQLPDSLTHKASSYHNPPFYFPEDPVFKGTVIRARAFRPGYIPGPTATGVYFIDPLGRSRFSLPVVHISTDASHFFDYHSGIYTPGIDFDTWRQNNPTATATGGSPGNYRRRGDEWEYPAHFTFIDTHNPEAVLSQDIGFRIHGGWSRALPMKTLRIYARGQYGNSELAYPFFPDQPYDAYRRILLRNSGNEWYFTLFRDALIQRVIGHMQLETQAYRPSILFVNSEFWGIHNIRERYDKHYLERVFGVNPEEIDYLEFNAGEKEGSNRHYLETLDYIRDNDIAQDEHYQHILTRIDTDNYIDYQIANIYAANTDWPGNNIEYWRKQTTVYQPNSPYGHDGRWRWMAFDMDFGFGFIHGTPASTHNTLAFAAQAGNTDWPNPDWSTFLFRSLLQNEQFRNEFINRFADHINTTFRADRINELITDFQQTLFSEMPEHIHRWKYPEDIYTWTYHIDFMRNFIDKRPARQRGHIMEFFNLPDTVLVTLDVAHAERGFIRINHLDLLPHTPGVDSVPYPWSGWYFEGMPITIAAVPLPGYKFSHWEGTGLSTATLITEPSAVQNIKAWFAVDEYKEPEPEYRGLIHYWYFGTAIPNDLPLESIQPHFSKVEGALLSFHSALEGYPFSSSSPWWRKASMERRNSPSPINYLPEGNNNLAYNAAAMRGLQIKQPFSGDGGENTLTFHMPAMGFEDVIFRFAAKDEFAVNLIIAEYAVSASNPQWTSSGLESNILSISKEYELYTLDFTGIAAIKNASGFQVRLKFICDDPGADNGHRVTFNNFSLEGNPTPVNTELQVSESNLLVLYPNPVKRGEQLRLPETETLWIYDLSGRLITSLINQDIFNTGSLSAGSYLLRSSCGRTAKLLVLP